MTAATFERWLRGAKRGDTTSYHIGLLMYDRDRLTNFNGWKRIGELADSAYAAFEAGKVALTQRRLEPGVCAYIATRL